MRLKFLFFPIMLIISVSIIIGYVWPEISNLKDLNQNNLSSQADLRSIQEKQAAIEKMGSQITSDSSGEAMVNNYLPGTKIEERIISGVNFLATDSGVSLINISIKDAVNDPANAAAGNSSNVVANILTGGVASASTTAQTPTAGTQPATITKDNVQYSEATISISGSYDKIKLFLDQLQRMPIYNIIKSSTITSQPQTNKTDNNAQPTDPTLLSANVVVDFGYLNPVKIDNQKIANFNPTLDSATISTLKQYVSQKAPGADNGGDSNGKTNPFLP